MCRRRGKETQAAWGAAGIAGSLRGPCRAHLFSKRQPTMNARVLLCDDEVHILRAAEFKLARAGYAVQCVPDGQAAWEAINRQRPELLITDFQMPRLDGLQLLARLRGDPALRDLPVIVLTAKGFELSAAQM